MGSAIGLDEVKNSIQRASKGKIMHLFYNVAWAEGHGPGEWDCALVRPL